MKVLFHHPLPLNERATSASGIRPIRMLNAFRDAGCEVEIIAGYSTERKRAIQKVKENVRAGVQYDLMYSESSTMPTALTDRHHLPIRPFMDFAFFNFCTRNGIPIGLFYRDIYWRFANYGKGLNPFKVLMAKAFYWFDLYAYQKTVTKLYLPSLEMGEYVPLVLSDRFAALPPGHDGNAGADDQIGSSGNPSEGQPLRLFYVGGMSSHYQMHKLFNAVSGLPRIQLTICTREGEWKAVQPEYPDLPDNIKVVHEYGDVMQAMLRQCDLALLFVKPQEYWEFAAPVKLYEYLGNHKPIIASAGTLAGRFVESQGVGWAVPYQEGSMRQILKYLLAEPESLEAVRSRCAEVAQEHSWQARARQVIEDLAV
ncbi:hypothetical protein A6K26_000015 [Gammaproteobacteria bacterium 2W06]|nr:hypothetical protein A6K26_000015 [Gammaproteobacteria bacterium 2W06]